MKLLIAGSRTFTDYNVLLEVLKQSEIMKNNERFTTIVSGGAVGIDSFAERYANTEGWSFELHKPDWKYYGKSAGYIRNSAMAKAADEAIIIWDGASKGTKHMIDLFKTTNKPLEIFIV